MKKGVLCAVLICMTTFSVWAREQGFFLERLSQYNLTVISESNNVLQYMGSKDGLKISFWANDKDVIKIIYTFDMQNKEKYTDQILEVSESLMPKVFKKSSDFSHKFLKALETLKKHGDDKMLRYKSIRYDMLFSNGLIVVTATPIKYYEKP